MKTGILSLLPLASLTLATLPVLAAESDIPRTASGRPDLSGNYDISTLTPVQRNPEFGDRRVFTAAEAEAIAHNAEVLTTTRSQDSDPNRDAPPAGANVGGYNFFWLDRGTAAAVIDGEYRTSILIDPADGRFPPLSEQGRERRAGLYPFSKKNTGTAWWLDRELGPYDGPETMSIADRCIYSQEATMPVLPKAYNNLKTIVQTESHIVINIEWMHHARIIRMSSEHLPAGITSRSGDSIGWWDGDTLVVDTTNFREESWLTTTLFGEPSPPAGLHVIERFTRTDDDTLLYQFTVESPDFEAPFSGEYPWPQTTSKSYEFACHEGNYAMGNMLRGARTLEKQASGQTP